MPEYINPYELEKEMLGYEPPNAPMTKKSRGRKPRSEFDKKNRLSIFFDPRVGMPVTEVSRSRIHNHRLTF